MIYPMLNKYIHIIKMHLVVYRKNIVNSILVSGLAKGYGIFFRFNCRIINVILLYEMNTRT